MRKLLGLPVAVAVTATIVAVTPSAQAAPAPAAAALPPGLTFVVNSTADSTDLTPGDGLCRASGSVCTLRAAIMESNASAGLDTIQLGSATYPITRAASEPDGPEAGDFDIHDNVTIVGTGAASTAVDGGAPGSSTPEAPGLDRLFEVHPSASAVTFQNLTLQDGYAVENGGAIMNWSAGLLRLEGVTLDGNLAGGSGGAIANGDAVEYAWPVPDPSHEFLPGGRIEIVDSTLAHNGATENGAAIYNQSKGSVTLLRSKVRDNPGEMIPDPQDPTGMIPAAGVFAPSASAVTNSGEYDGAGTIRFTDSFVTDNWSEKHGAGVTNEGDGSLVLDNTKVTGNTSLDSGGGLFTHGGTVTIRNSDLSGNTANNGGAISSEGASTTVGLRAKLTITDSTINGNDAVASGGGIESGGDGQVSITDTTLSGNTALDAGGGLNHGGRAGLDLTRVTFDDNESSGEGGGAYVGGERLATIADSTFTNNRGGVPEPPEPGQPPDPVPNIASGGGLYTENGPAEITRSKFIGNHATDTGGAFALDNHGDVKVIDTLVRGNRADVDGGGIENSGAQVLFDRMVIEDNRAGLDGGGIYNSSSGEFTIRRTTVRNNSGVNGGGLANAPDNKMYIKESLFLRNTARHPGVGEGGEVVEGGHGGGIWSMADGDTHVENTTLSRNTAATGGGGLFHDADGELKLSNVTIWRNSAPIGGGIGVVESDFVPEVPPKPNVAVILRNTIVGGSLEGGSCDYYVTSEGGNLATDRTCFISVLEGDPQYIGVRDRTGDPQLDAIADNGGATLTHQPRYGSLAIDGGSTPCPEIDQRGTARPQNGKCDTGAVEYVGAPPPADDVPPDSEYLSGPTQDSLETMSFEFTGSDNLTPASELQFECRFIELELTEAPEPTAPWDPVDPALAWHTCASPWSIPLVEEGLYDFEVRAIDRAGNVDPTPDTLHFDGTDQVPPNTIIEQAPPSPTSARTATFTFTATDNITPPQFMEYECRLDSRDPDLWLECFNPAIYSNLTTGEHTMEVRATDGMENVDPTPARYTWTVGQSGTTNCDAANITLTANADAWVDQVNPTENYLFHTELEVRSDATGDPTADPPQPIVGQNARALVKFPVPSDAPGCELESAVLKLYSGSHTEGRTLEALPLAGAFKESTVTWSSQPAAVSPDGATTGAGEGYRSFDVTSDVTAMLAGDLVNHGWSIRDAAESEPGGGDQSFSSREEPQDPPDQTLPVLELTYAADATPPPPAPVMDPGTVPSTVHCGQVIKVDTIVGNDLHCPLTEGLVIGAPNIVLDLGGHTIDGPDYLLNNSTGQEEGFPAGIRNSGHTNVIIRNGTVQELGYGVLLTSGVTRNVVEDLTILRNAVSGIELFDADDGRTGNTVQDNTILDNELGVSLMAGAQNSLVRRNVIGGNLGEQILVHLSSGNRFEDNQIHGIPSDPALDSDGGVLFDGSSNNTVVGGFIRDTGDAGIVVERGSHGTRVEGTSMYRNGDAGVIVGSSDRTVIVGVVSHQQSDGGVVLNNAHDTVVRDSDLRFNPSGIEASGVNRLIVENNDLSDSLASGIELGHSLLFRIIGNTANNTGGSGISVEAGELDANGAAIGGGRIEDNTANGNAQDGIVVADGGHTIRDNDAHNNAGFGINIGENPEVAGEPWPHTNLAPPTAGVAPPLNRATGNAEVTQCSGLLCAAEGSVPVTPVDTEGPATVVISGPADPTAETTATFAFTATDNVSPATALLYECRLDAPPDPAPEPEEPEPPTPGEPPVPSDPPEGAEWFECSSPVTYRGLEEGAHHFEVRAIDFADNVDLTPARYEWNIDYDVEEEGEGPDSTPPDTRIATGPVGTTESNSANFTFAGSDNSTPGLNLTYECRYDGPGTGSDTPWAPCTSPVSYADLPNGVHTFEVRASDRAPIPNTDPSPASRTWTVAVPTDTTPPETTLTDGPDHVTTLRTASFEFSSEDPTATFQCQLDGGPWETCASPKVYDALATGADHDFRVRAVDPAGNADPTPAGRTWFVGAAPTPGFVFCGQVITTSIVVRNDLIDCEWDGIRIGASNVTVDLDGHTIDGKGIAAAIRNDGFDNVTIKNGKLVDFDYGVMLNPGTTGNIVEGLDIESNQEAGISLGVVPHPVDPLMPWPDPAPPSFQSNVIGNILRGNTISANATGIYLTNRTTDTQVRENEVQASGEDGIWIERSNGNKVEHNNVIGTSGHAVLLEGALTNTILENDLSDGGGGIMVGVTTTGTPGLPSNDNRIEKNTIQDVSESGIEISESHRTTVLQNVVKFSGGDGVELYRSDENLIKDNDLRGNKGGLSLITASSNRVEGNDASDSEGTGISLEALSLSNQLVVNTSSNNDGDGIYVGDETAASSGVWLEGNRTHNNKGYGIYVAKVSHVLKANIANDNGGWGIWADAGSNGRTNTDAGGNKAQGNLGPPDPFTLKPMQCFTIRCDGSATNPPDAVAPETSITARPDNPSGATVQRFTFTGSDNTGDVTFQCAVAGAEWTPCTSPFGLTRDELIALTGHAIGTHNFQVRAVDLAGNVDLTPASYTWQVGEEVVEPAAVKIVSGPDARTVATRASFELSTSGDGTLECSIDGTAYAPCSSPVDYTNLAVGEHTFIARFTSGAGEVATAQHSWRITTAAVATAISCGDVIVRSIRVTNDLVNCPGVGVIVGAGDITIDLDGHTIDGTGLEAGILNNGFDGVTITGGAVHEFDYGIHLGPGSGRNIVDGVTAELNQEAGIALSDADQNGAGSTVRNSTLVGNGYGIATFSGTRNAVLHDNVLGANAAVAIYLEHSTAVTVRENELANNTAAAIATLGGGSHVIVDNELRANAGGILVGEELLGSNNTRVERNVLNGGAGGIVVVDSSGVVVADNSVRSTTGEGILLELSEDSIVTRNTLSGTAGGITLDQASGNEVTDNKANDTSGTGIEINELSVDNNVSGNTTSGNGGEGIAVVGTSPIFQANRIERNTADSNGGDGISVEGGGQLVKDNATSFNGGWGIYAIVGGVDGGGNFAAGNMEPGQCYNVVCTEGTVPGAPETWIVDKPALVSNSRNATFTYNASDDNYLTHELVFQCRIDVENPNDPESWQDCEYPAEFLNLMPGEHTVEIRAVEPTGLADGTPATYTWEYVPLPSGVAPSVTIDITPPAETWLPDAIFTFHADEPDVTFECKVDLHPYEPCGFDTASHMSQGAFEWGLLETEVGPHTFYVRAIDAEGNVGQPTTHTWRLLGVVTSFTAGPGFTPPTEPGEPATGGPTTENSATISFEANVADATFECSLDLEPFTPCTSPVTETGLIAGDHMLRVVATHPEFGTELEAAVYEWEIVDTGDAVPPETSIELAPPSGSSATMFEFTGFDNATPSELLLFQCRLDSTNELDWTECISPFSLLDLYTYEDPEMAPGEHTFEVRAIDAADPAFPDPNNPEFEGNVDPTPATYTWTSVADTTPPGTGISGAGLPATIGQETEAVVAFFGTDNATPVRMLTFECSVDGEPFAACESPVTVTGLEPGAHELRIRAVDLAGNRDALTPAVETWTVVAAPVTTITTGPAGQVVDGQPPAMPGTSEAATFVFEADQAGSTFECSLNGAEFAPCTSPDQFLVEESGTHELAIRATNPEGVVGEATVYEWMVELGPDVTAPNTTISTGPAAVSQSSVATFTFSGSDNRTLPANLTYECAIDSTTAWNSCTSPEQYSDLVKGTHTLRVRTVDAAGNFDTTPATYTWVVELPPITTILTGPDDPTNVRTARFTFESDVPGSTFTCWLDGVLEPCTSPMTYAGPIADGEHLFAVYATAPGGTVALDWTEYEWVVGETEAPITIIDSGPGQEVERTEPIEFAFSTTATGTTFECQLDGGNWAPCTSPRNYEQLAVGDHTFRVQAVHPLVMGPDGQYLERLYEPIPATYTFTVVDTVPPDTELGYGPVATTTSPNAYFGFTNTEGGTVECSLDNGGWSECAPPHVLTDLAVGSHTIRARAVDESGLVDPSPLVYTWTITSAANNTPVGNQVRVELPNGFTVTFPSVSAAGATTAGGVTGGPSMPAGYRALRHFDVSTTAGHETPVRVCAAYDPTGLTGAARLLWFDGTVWLDVTLTNNPATGQVCAESEEIADLGLFALAAGTGVYPLASITAGPENPTTSTNATFTFVVDQPDAIAMCSIDALPYVGCTSPMTYTHLEEGEHEFKVKAYAGQSNPFEPPPYVWEIVPGPDVAPPDTEITSGPGELTGSYINWFGFTGSDDRTAALELDFECRVDNGIWESCSSPAEIEVLTAGDHVAEIRALDEAGNADPTPATRSYRVIDVSAPDTEITLGPDSETTETSATFEFLGEEPTGEPVTEFECKLDNAEEFTPCTSPYTVTGLSSGPHLLEVRAKDPAGVVDPSPDYYEWLITGAVDTTPPDTSILVTPSDPSGPDSVFAFQSSELGDEFECRLDGGIWEGCSATLELTGLASGSHTLEVRALDLAEVPNVDPTPASHTWTVIGEPQTTITSHPPAIHSSHMATFEFTSDQPAATFRCSVDGSAFVGCASPFVAGPLAKDQEHTFEVRAGNGFTYLDGTQVVDQTPAEFTFRIQDNEAPETSIVSAVRLGPNDLENPNSLRAEITGTDNGTVWFELDFECRLVADGVAGQWQGCETPYHYVSLEELAGGSYVLQARATDELGNVDATPAEHAFTVEGEPETTILSGPPAESDATTASFDLGTDGPAGTTYQCALDGGTFSACPDPAEFAGIAYGEHELLVRAIAPGGRTDLTPAAYSWVTGDLTPPVVAILDGPADSTSTSATFMLSVDDPEASLTCSLDGATPAAFCDPMVTFTDLAVGEHTLVVSATKPHLLGSVVEATHTWTVLDATEPATTLTVTPLAEIALGTEATYEFTSELDATFECSLDGGVYAGCGSPQVLSGLAAGEHTFAVRAVDTSGNTDSSPETHAFTVVGPATTTILSGPADGSTTTSRSAVFTFSADQPQVTFACSLDGEPVPACSSGVSFADLAYGSHRFEIASSNRFDLVEAPPVAIAWIVEQEAPGVPPETTISSGPEDIAIVASATFEFTADQPDATFECRLDAGVWAACTSPHSLTALTEGEHTLLVRATSAGGVQEDLPASYTWTVDLPPDTFIDSGPPDGTISPVAEFELRSDDSTATFECALDGDTFGSCARQPVFAGLLPGEHTLLVRAVDANGTPDPTPASHAWTQDEAVDTTLTATFEHQTLPVPGDPLGDVVSESRDASFTVTSNKTGATFECALDEAADAGTYTACPDPLAYDGLALGEHTLLVRAVTALGTDETPAEFEWSIGRIPQQVEITDAPPATTEDRTAAFTFASPGAAGYECRLDGTDWSPCTSPTTYTGLAFTSHTFEVRELDATAVAEPPISTHTWTVSKATVPETTLDAAPAFTSASATFSFTSNETGVTFECSLDGVAFAACESPVALTALALGEHTFRVRAVDAAGQADASAASHTWEVIAAPETTVTGPDPAVPTGATASFTLGSDAAGSTFECALDVETVWRDCDAAHQETGLADGEHTLFVRATSRGVTDETPAEHTWTVSLLPGTTILAGPADPTVETAASFGFSSDEANVTYWCSLDAGEYAECVEFSDTVQHRLTDVAVGQHTLRVAAEDADGNRDATPATYTWTVLPVPDTTIDTAPESTSESAAASFEFSSTAGNTFECQLDGGAWAACTSPRAYDELALGNHTFRVRSVDAHLNVDPAPASHTWTVVEPRETDPPETSLGQKPDPVTTSTTASFGLVADELGATFRCRLDSGAWESCTSPAVHTVALGEHTFQAEATDAAGNVDATPVSYTWTVVAEPQTAIESAPETGTPAPAAFAFSSPLAGATFECRLDGGPWTACTSPMSYADIAAGEHTFAVRAVGYDGAVADPSPATYTWTVAAAADAVAPETTIGSGPADPTASTTASVAFTGTDDRAGALSFECRLDGGAWAACTSPRSLTSLTAGLHTFTVRAIDGAGNVDNSPAVHQWLVSSSAAPNCGAQQTLIANADAWIDQNSPSTNKGTDSTLKVQSKSGTNNMRAAVKFPLPTAPAGCTLQSATLRIWTDSPISGRTIQAVPLAATWTEGGITWANQPGTTGTAVGVPSGSAKGWREWNVVTQTAAMLSANHGFLIRDSVEGQGSSEQQFFGREKGGAERPQLVIRFVAAPSDTVDPDTSITSGPPATTTSTSAAFGFSSTEAGGTFECSLDGAPYTVCTSGVSYTGLAAGAHNLRVRARDAASNVDDTPARQDWTIQ